MPQTLSVQFSGGRFFTTSLIHLDRVIAKQSRSILHSSHLPECKLHRVHISVPQTLSVQFSGGQFFTTSLIHQDRKSAKTRQVDFALLTLARVQITQGRYFSAPNPLSAILGGAIFHYLSDPPRSQKCQNRAGLFCTHHIRPSANYLGSIFHSGRHPIRGRNKQPHEFSLGAPKDH